MKNACLAKSYSLRFSISLNIKHVPFVCDQRRLWRVRKSLEPPLVAHILSTKIACACSFREKLVAWNLIFLHEVTIIVLKLNFLNAGVTESKTLIIFLCVPRVAMWKGVWQPNWNWHFIKRLPCYICHLMTTSAKLLWSIINHFRGEYF